MENSNQKIVTLQGVEYNSLLSDLRSLIKDEIKIVSPSQPVNDIIGVVEAAKFLGFSKSTIYRLTSTSAIPFMKKNNTCFFSRRELESWVRSGKRVSVENL